MSGDLTLSLHGRDRRVPGDPAPQPLLVIALECSRPAALSARHLLTGVDLVLLGRGGERSFERRRAVSSELAIRIPDRWMSSNHARIERSFGRWVLEDARSKNGTLVNGAPVERAVLRDGDLIELGHTLVLFRDSLSVGDGEPPDLDLGLETLPARPPGTTTLVPPLARQLERLHRVADSTIPVLVHGESGTGKELLARAVHALSGRRGEFVAVNCGAIPANLVESELFGHKKGAFSGAGEERPGLVRAADGGTLFLDEIGDLPGSSQAALLRVLQEREVLPVGGTRPVKVDVRLVCATHRDLEGMVTTGEFRHDLYARVVGFRMDVPPLRERREDLGLLVGVLLGRRLGDLAAHPGFEPEAARLIFSYSWPLNVRELENCLQTASVLAGSEPIAVEHLPPTLRGARAAPAPARPAEPALGDEDRALRDNLLAKLREHRGNISAVARDLGKDRKQIQRWLKRFGLAPDVYR
jgi:transcriptional regulator with AAA-type ATPase domain